MVDASQFENYDEHGNYVGAFSVEKPFGPHVRKCVCDRCHKAFLAESRIWQEESARREAAMTPEQKESRKRIANRILDEILANPKPKPTPNPAQNLKVGDRVTVHGNSMSNGRVGTVVELPGPSKKYNGADAQRIEILLDATADYEWATIWSDNSQYGWLERTNA